MHVHLATMNFLRRIACYTLIFFYTYKLGFSSKITVPPISVYAKGTTAWINCTYELEKSEVFAGVYWYRCSSPQTCQNIPQDGIYLYYKNKNNECGPGAISSNLCGRLTLTPDVYLAVSNAAINDSGTYECVIDASGLKNKTTEIAIVDKPGTPQIAGLLAVIINNMATLTCTVTGQYITYAWTKDGSPLSTSTLTTITIKPTTKTNETYTCTAVNVAGTSTSATHTVTVNYKPEVTLNKVSGKDWKGDTLELQCSVDDASPSTSLSLWWYKDGKHFTIDNTKYVFINNTRTLQIKNLTTSDNGVYKCVVSNTVGAGTSNHSTLDVKYKPKVTVNNSLDTTEGISSVNIPCTWTANPNTGLTSTWSHNSDNNIDTQPHYTVGQDGSLTIANVKYPRDNGKFTCVVTNSIGTGQASVTVHVKYCPRVASNGFSVTGSQNGVKKVKVNTKAHMTCTVDSNLPGNPMYTGFVWFKGTSKIQDTVNTYDLTVTSVADNGTYHCRPRSSICSDGRPEVPSNNMTIDVTTPPHVEKIEHSSTANPLYNDSTFTIACYASGNPAVSIIWLKDSRTLTDGAGYITKIAMVSYSGQYGQTTSTKSILRWTGNVGSDITCGNVNKYAGRYQCQANNNGIGTDDKSQVQHISVQYGPIYNGTYALVAAAPTESATLSCDVCANPFPGDNSFKWTFNGAVVHTGQTYTIPSVNVSQFGVYTCSVNNSHGSINLMVNLTERGPPRKVREFKVNSANTTSSSVSLSWKPGFDGGYTQTFTIEYKQNTESKYEVLQSGIPDTSNGGTMYYHAENLEQSTTYDCRIKAINTRADGVNESPFSTLSDTTKVKPQVKLDSIKRVSNGVKIEWSVTAGELEQFIIEYKESGSTSWNKLYTASDLQANKTGTITVNKTLDERKDYEFRTVVYEGLLQTPSIGTATEPQILKKTVSSPEDNMALIAAIAGSVCAVLIIIIVVVVCRYKRKHSGASTEKDIEMKRPSDALVNDKDSSSGKEGMTNLMVDSNAPDVISPYGVSGPRESLNNTEDISPYNEYIPNKQVNGNAGLDNTNTAEDVDPLYDQANVNKKAESAAKTPEDLSALYAQPDKPKRKPPATEKKQLEDPSALYAQPDKSKKKPATDKAPLEDPSSLYAQPDKSKKKPKADNEAKPADPVYAQPDKTKKKDKKEKDKKEKDKKAKKGKKKVPKKKMSEPEGPYENVARRSPVGSENPDNPYENSPRAYEHENPYSNVEEENSKQPKNVGPDGTIYADLDHSKLPGKKATKINRKEEATEYAAIDFKKKAPK